MYYHYLEIPWKDIFYQLFKSGNKGYLFASFLLGLLIGGYAIHFYYSKLRFHQLENKLTDATNLIGLKDSALSTLQNSFDALQEEYDIQEQLLLQLEGDLSTTRTQVTSQEQQLVSLKSDLKILKSKYDNLHTAHEQLRISYGKKTSLDPALIEFTKIT